MNNRQEAETALLEQVLKLPRATELEIPEDYLDGNRHVNMMYYTLIANLGWRSFFEEIGLPREHFLTSGHSTFALRQFLSYYNELKEGDKVAVHGGFVDYDLKRLHFMFYIVNLTSHKLASSDERLIMYVDMATRRSTTFDPSVMSRLQQTKEAHAALGWQPTLSGAISVKK